MRMKMRTAYILISVCGIGFFAFAFLGQIRPSALEDAISVTCLLGLLTALIATLIIGLARWRKSSRWWMGPTLLCIAFFVGIKICGNAEVWTATGDWWFKKHIASYVAIVDSIQSGAIRCSPTFDRIYNVTSLPPYTKYVSAARCPDGSVLVEFHSRADFPPPPMGYLFKNYTETNSCIK